MKQFLKQFANATLIGILLYIVFLAIFYFNGRTLVFDGYFWRDLLEHMIYSWLIYLANALLIAVLGLIGLVSVTLGRRVHYLGER